MWDCRNFIQYACKPVDFWSECSLEFPAAAASGQVAQLNQLKDELVSGWEMVTMGRKQHTTYGMLNHASRSFVGARKQRVPQQRKKVKEMLQEISEEQAASR
jgi:hypothetical protein